MFSVEEVMTTDLLTLPVTATVNQAIVLMARQHIRHIPLVNNKGELKGLVSDRDLLRSHDNQERPVSEIMTKNVVTVDEHASIRTTANYLSTHKIGCLPVTSDGKLTGIITETDFIAVAANLLEQLELSEPVEENIR